MKGRGRFSLPPLMKGRGRFSLPPLMKGRAGVGSILLSNLALVAITTRLCFGKQNGPRLYNFAWGRLHFGGVREESIVSGRPFGAMAHRQHDYRNNCYHNDARVLAGDYQAMARCRGLKSPRFASILVYRYEVVSQSRSWLLTSQNRFVFGSALVSTVLFFRLFRVPQPLSHHRFFC